MTTEPSGLVLAVESSCDETGIALIEDGRTILSNVVASQTALHATSGKPRALLFFWKGA